MYVRHIPQHNNLSPTSLLITAFVAGATNHTGKQEKGITAAWRSPNGGGNSKTGRELQNRAWLPPIDRQAHDTHAQFFSPNQNSADSKDFIGCQSQC